MCTLKHKLTQKTIVSVLKIFRGHSPPVQCDLGALIQSCTQTKCIYCFSPDLFTLLHLWLIYPKPYCVTCKVGSVYLSRFINLHYYCSKSKSNGFYCAFQFTTCFVDKFCKQLPLLVALTGHWNVGRLLLRKERKWWELLRNLIGWLVSCGRTDQWRWSDKAAESRDVIRMRRDRSWISMEGWVITKWGETVEAGLKGVSSWG